MPIAVTKYRCAFKCGKKAVGVEKDMRRHEQTCWKNPENKTCNTCSNQIYRKDYDYYESGEVCRGCKLEPLNEVLADCANIMRSQNVQNVRPVYKCRYWNGEADDYLPVFARILSEEIKGDEEGTEHYPFYNKPFIKDEKTDLFGNKIEIDATKKEAGLGT